MGAYHVQAENLLVEVLDERGVPCRPGQVGRVVVTGLHDFAAPLIRYEIGDYAMVGEPCPCGRGLPVLERIMGRGRNMLTLPNGQRRWPTFGDLNAAEEAALPPIQQFQCIQKTVDLIEIRLVAPQRFTPDEEAALRAYLTRSLKADFQFVFSYVESIPRSAGGKFEDFRSEVKV